MYPVVYRERLHSVLYIKYVILETIERIYKYIYGDIKYYNYDENRPFEGL